MKKLSKISLISMIILSLVFIGCFEKIQNQNISNIEIIEYTITAQKRIKEGCCYENITINNGFNYSYDVQFYVVNGTLISKNTNCIEKLKIIGNFNDANNIELITRTDYILNLSYLTEKKFKIIVENHYSFKEFNKINNVKFEFEIL